MIGQSSRVLRTAGRRLRQRTSEWMKSTAERGDAVLETVIVLPIVLLVLGGMIVGGRVAIAHQRVEHAAAEAARAASIARPAITAAAPAARAAAEKDMVAKGLICTSKRVDTDVSMVKFEPGIPAQVRVTITCEIDLNMLGIPGISGHRTITHSAASAVDTYRERVR